MRRSVLSVLLLLAVLLATPAFADDGAVAEASTVVLAVDEITGPDPMPRDAEDNPARELGGFEDRELQFTWGAAWLLAGAFGLGLLAAGSFYYFRVRRPVKEAAGRR